MLSGCREPLELEAELRRLEHAMAAGDEAAMNRYAGVQARFEAAGGYGWRERARSVVHGLGFTDDDLDRPLRTFSGGQLTRASLARALAAQPDLLLLDEPTNHLDIESLEWLEQTLLDLDAAIVLVAHDRWFLETVGTAVLELEAGRARFFKGTWHAWRREQAARELALGRAIEKQQAEIERMERFVERFRFKATKARQAQERLKKLNKIERIERDPRDGRGLEFAFKKPERSGRVIFELEDGRLEVGADPPRVLLDDAELWLERGEHVSLVGPNGTGKTTLIQALVGERPLDGGRLRSGHNVKVGYLSQHAEELEGGGARTVLEAAVKRTGLPPNQARALLGRFLFSGEEADKPLDGLSGGERRRLSLAILVAVGRQRADPRRADQPPRPRVARGARGRAAGVPGLADPRHARPRAARRRGHAHGRRRGLRAALLRRRLGRVRARARGAQGDGAAAVVAAPAGDQRRAARQASPPKAQGPAGEAQARRPVEEPRARAGAAGARRRAGRGGAGGGRGGAGRPEGLGHQVRVGQVDGPPHGGQAGGRGGLRGARGVRGQGLMLRHELPGGYALRLPEEADAQELYDLVAANREHLRPWMPWVLHPSAEDVLPFIRLTRKQIADNDGVQTVIVDPGGRIVGMIGTHGVDWRNA